MEKKERRQRRRARAAAASPRALRAQARLACESRPPPRRGRPETPARRVMRTDVKLPYEY